MWDWPWAVANAVEFSTALGARQGRPWPPDADLEALLRLPPA